ncbi:MAG: hypothetical protein CMO80_22235 [Verrucomicrobiales bacterium]|nr:hypothetical protein [Verrucomicrobiales bacterium]|tara:strand:+ start:39440 stop:39841 length:402 start_codon:yes stop_codon:yes gene_type:complete
MSFGWDITFFTAKTIDKMNKVIRMSAYDLFASIVLETPVDKGVLRNNWFASIDARSGETTTEKDPSGAATTNRINEVLKNVKLDDLIYLSNNLAYALPIEFDGHSGKAPHGMVRVNTVRWETIVANNVRRFNK